MKNKTLSERKVAIVGSGFVGSSIAYALTIRNLAHEIVLIDIDKAKAEGEALDICHGIPYMGISQVRAGDYSDCADCDLIIITAGRNRKPHETRLNLIVDNVKIVKAVIDGIKPHYNNGAIMVVSNPVDIITAKVTEWMNLPDGKVFGSGCILDTSRLNRAVCDYTGLSTDVVKGFVVGEHGDLQVPIWSRVSIAGVPIKEYCKVVGLEWNKDIRDNIASRVKKMGAEIISGKGRTNYGIATCVCYLADAVLNQRPTIASISTILRGEYNITEVALSVPSIIGVNGVERRLEERWSEYEFNKFSNNATNLKEVLKKV